MTDRTRSSASPTPPVSLADLWARAEKLLVPSGSTAASRQQARQAFYAGVTAVVGRISEAAAAGDAKEVRRILDSIQREIGADAAERSSNRTIWK